MKPTDCLDQQRIVAALDGHTLSNEQASHLEHCTACAEAMRVAGALRQMTSTKPRQLPDAHWIWRRGQRRRQQRQMARFAQVLLGVRVAAGLYVVLAVAWILHRYTTLADWDLHMTRNEWLMGLPLLIATLALGAGLMHLDEERR